MLSSSSSSSSTLKPVVSSLPTAPEPNGSHPKALPMFNFNKSLQMKGKRKELSLQEASGAGVSRRELIGLAATTLGGLALYATKPAEALEVADIGSSIKQLFGFSKGKSSKTGAGSDKNSKVENEKRDDKGKPKSEGDAKKPTIENNGNKPKNEEKPKVEANGNKPKVEADDHKKASTPHLLDKEKVSSSSSSSSAAPTLPNILSSVVP